MTTHVGATPTPWTEVPTTDRFAGKTVIVTGAGSGIGRATALRIAREGGRVIASDISVERLEALTVEHPQLDLLAVAGDVAEEADVARIMDAAGPTIHGLANIAGIMDDFSPAAEVTDDMWERVFRINVTGPLRLTRAALRQMVTTGSGSIVNIASEAGIRGSAAGVAYTASKHAVVGLTKNTAFMYGGEGIRVNAVAPGAVYTNMKASFGSEIAERRITPLVNAMVPTPAQADQLAAAITFLLSDDATNINGVVLPSDGGWSAV